MTNKTKNLEDIAWIGTFSLISFICGVCCGAAGAITVNFISSLGN